MNKSIKKESKSKALAITQETNTTAKTENVVELTNLLIEKEAQLTEFQKDWKQLEYYVLELNARTNENGKPKRRVLGFLISNYKEIIEITKLIIKLILKNTKNPKLKDLNVDQILN